MHKSTNAKLQIKKKRKYNNYFCYKSNNNNNNAPTLMLHALDTTQPLGEKIRIQNYHHLLNNAEPLIVADVDIGGDDNRANTRVNNNYNKKKFNNQQRFGCCLRDQQQQQSSAASVIKMPLSQGYLHCTNNNNNNNSNTNNNSNSNTKINFNASNKKPAAIATKRRYHANLTATAPRASEAHKKFVGIENLQHTRTAQLLGKNVAANNNGNTNNKLHLSYLLGESLARCGRLFEAFDIYAIIANDYLEGFIPLDRVSILATCLISYIKQQQQQQQTQQQQSGSSSSCENSLDFSCNAQLAPNIASTAKPNSWQNVAEASAATAKSAFDSLNLQAGTHKFNNLGGALTMDFDLDSVDPLLCPLCQDILRCPVTTNCGHTFCRQCCETITMCHICEVKFPRTNFDDHAMESSNVASASSTMSLLPQQVNSDFLGLDSSTSVNSDNFLNGRYTNSTRNSNMLPLNNLRLLPATASQHLTVTTTTVASTTATATTTMASSPTPASSSPSSAASLSSSSSMRAPRSQGTGSVDSMKFMPDVLVRRLVEKWWGADLQAKKINETAASYMHLNLLDDALKFCNASLEKSPTNFKSLLLRAEVLRKLNHFQSSLADIDNALKSRYTSAKAHYQRSLALAELGRYDEALFNNCLAISLDKSTNLTMSELFQHDLAKLLQKLLVPAKKLSSSHRTFVSHAPYNILSEQRLRRKHIGLLSNANGDHLSSYLVEDEDDYGIKRCEEMIVDDDFDDALLGIGGGRNSPTREIYNSVAKDYELTLHRQNTRKHWRRKWIVKETELMPTDTQYDGRCEELFRSILTRTQQEVQRLRKLQSTDEAQERQLISVNPSLIDASDFDCVLCCRTFWKPVVTPCGHTYCWVCLDRCMDYTSSCPLCMSPLVEPYNINAYPPGSSSPVPFVLAKRPVTKFLEAAMKRFIPDNYARRFHQEMDMEPSVPVFICTTAFPYVPCPLFVYEPRYRLMVRRAVESGEKQFGIVQSQSGKSRYFDVGTILDIRDCVLLGDGCTILSTIGCKRFKILARNEKDGYETAKVEYIYDETIAEERIPYVSSMHAAVLHKATDWFESLSTEFKQEILQSFGEMPPVEDGWERLADGPAWAWWIIALLPLGHQLKVDILATTLLEKRLRAIEKTLDYMSGTFRRSAPESCSVVVQQQQQQQQHQQQQQQQEHCDDDELSQSCQAEECCQRSAAAAAALVTNNDQHAHGSESHSQLVVVVSRGGAERSNNYIFKTTVAGNKN